MALFVTLFFVLLTCGCIDSGISLEEKLQQSSRQPLDDTFEKRPHLPPVEVPEKTPPEVPPPVEVPEKTPPEVPPPVEKFQKKLRPKCLHR